MNKAIMLNGLGGGITDAAVFEYSFEQTQSIFSYRWVHNLGWTPSTVIIRLITEPQIPTNTSTFCSAITYVDTRGTRVSSYTYLKADGTFASAGNFTYEANDDYALMHPSTGSIAYVQAGNVFRVIFIK